VITEQRESRIQFLGPVRLSGTKIGADGQDLRFVLIKFRDTRLVRREFLRSTTCESGREESYDYILLAAVTGQLNVATCCSRQFEIGGLIPDFEVRLWRRRLCS
jgi:hypothetical protein